MEKENALKILRELHDKALFSERTALETFIPELKESEDNADEKVRKALIKLVTNHASMDLFIEYDIHLDEALSWLEKQGEHKTADEVERKTVWSEEDEDYISDLIKYFSQNERLENTEKDIVIWLKSLKERIGG